MTITLRALMLTSLLTPTLSYAFFCPNNFNQINFGDDIEMVRLKCGAPDKEEKKTEEPNVPQEWSYYIPQTVSMGGGNQQESGTLKTSITFDKEGKALNISVNGLGVGSSTICGSNIALGNTREEIKQACGAPAFVNMQKSSSDAGIDDQPKKVVIFTYLASQPTTLTFENGLLVKKEP